MKKLITTFVLGCLIWTSYSFAQPTFTFSPQDTTAGPGETLTFEVSVTDFTDILSFQFSMNWDPNVLDYVSVNDITTDITGFTMTNFGTQFTSDGKLTVSWFDPNVTGVSLPNGSILFSLTFDVLSTDGSDLAITGDPTVIEVIDSNGDEIGLISEDASINGGGSGGGGGGGGGGGNSSDLIISANQINAANGDQICLDISVENFDNILSMQYSMNFDASVLEYVEVTNLNLQDLAPSNFGTTMTGNGVLTLSWFDNTNASGVTVPDNTVIYQACFDVIGSMGENSPFDFTSTPTIIEVFNGDGNPVDVTTNSGAVNVTSGGGGNPSPTGLIMTASDETGNEGETVCLDISVENFDNILSMQFSMNFDETVLQYDEVANLNLQDLAPSNFGTTMVDNGILTLSWFDNTNASGVTVSDGTVIFQTCFLIIGGDGTQSSFDFTSNPTVIEIFDGDSNPVDFTGNSGSVEVGDGPPPPPPPAEDGLINASDHEPQEGEEFCMDITVKDFNNILSMQFSMNFDPAELEFQEIMLADNLEGLVGSNIGTDDSDLGELTLSWFDPNAVGITLDDGTLLFQVCFKTLGSCGTTTSFDFTSNPVPIEIIDGDENEVDFTSNPGVVDICGVVDPPPPPPSGDGLIVASDHEPQPGDNFCMEFTVNDFTDIISMQYSMNFDPDELEYVEVIVPNPSPLPGLASSQFGVAGAGNGDITMSWFDPNTTGVTLVDGTVIYEICFNTLGSCGTVTNLDFSDSPTVIEVVDASGEIDLTSDAGVVNICGDGTDPVDFEMIGSEQVVANGDDICVEVSTKGFTDVVSMQYSMQFDPTIIQFTAVQNFGLPDMSASSFGTSQTNDGKLSVSWFDPNTTGVSVADNTILYEVCFTAIGDSGDISPFDFTSDPTVLEFGGPSGTLAPILTNGFVEIGQPCNNPIILDNSVVEDVECNGDTNGLIDITVSGGDDVFAYEWRDDQDVVISNNDDLTGVGAGTYTLIVTSCGGLVSLTENFEITEPTAITINPVATDVNCFGDNDGTITTNTSGGAAPYNYIWSDNNIVSDDDVRINLGPGTYSFTVTDITGCTEVSEPIVIAQPAELTADVDVVKPPCAGDNSGSISIIPTGGTQPYEYSLDCIVWVPSSDFLNIPAGVYTVGVRDSKGCVTKVQDVNISEPDPISITINTTIDNGNCNGSATATVTGGTGGPAYNYSWGNGPVAANLCAGSYCLTVTDINGCEAVECYDISRPLEIVDDAIQGACWGINNGEIQFNVIGGVVNNPTYTYQWDPQVPNPNGEDQTDLAGDTYCVTVTSVQDGQTATQCFNVPQATTPVSIGMATIDHPNGPTTFNGSIIISGVMGGYGGPYTYKWSPDLGNTPSPNGLGQGTYNLTVCDSEGCNISAAYELEVIPDDLLISPFDYEDATCSDSDDGTLSFSIEGGLAPYTVTVTNDDTFPATVVYFKDDFLPGNLENINDLIPGNYTITIEYDVAGISDLVTSSFVIDAPAEITIDPFKITNKTDAELGEIDIFPQGGDGLYQFFWSNGDDAQNPTELDDDCYTVTVVDSKGCFKVFNDLCVEHFRVVGAQITHNFCANDTDGSITPNIEGTAGTPSCVWTSTNGFTSNICNISGLQSGIYTLVVTDSCGVETPPYDFEVESESEIQVTVTPTTIYQGFNISCNGLQDGAALAIASGGVAPYDYVWSDDSMDSTLTNLPAGSFSITVTDVFGCQAMGDVTLTQPDKLDADILAVSNPTCFGLQNGSAEAIGIGGNPYPGNSYIYQWSNGTSGQDVSIVTLLGSGDYQVTVSDRNGCQAVIPFTVENPEEVYVEIKTTADKGDADGTALADVNGGQGPFTFEWRFGGNVGEVIDGDGQFIDGLITGFYFVTVTDANGCTAFDLDGGHVGAEFACFQTKAVITPDGDGNNEEFIIGCTDKFQDNRLEIFNRWGQLVYEANDYVCQQGTLESCWTGTNVRGEDLPEGTYFYVFDYIDPVTNEEGQRRGAVTILRQ